MTELQKIEDALNSTDEMMALCRRQLDTLTQLREGLRIRKVIPELDIKQPVQIVNYKVGFTSNMYVKAGEKEYPLTLKQYNYIRGERDDF